jgi:hypothetical protein
MEASSHINLRDLKQIKSFGFLFTRQTDQSFCGFNDVDWADDRRNIGVYFVFHDHNLIMWSCKQQ